MSKVIENVSIVFDLDLDKLDILNLLDNLKQNFDLSEEYSLDFGKSDDYSNINEKYLNCEKFVAFDFKYNEIEFRIALAKYGKFVNLSSIDFETNNTNDLLRVIDILCRILEPSAVYDYKDPESLEKLKSDSEVEPNKINYWSEKEESWKKYNYVVGEENKIDE
ncbi:hypothetical protein GF361_03415 [Candidatus Woesearchaeota archaeon]|nr:hypothetical protein [Candidatus Woesearchaeota archaeon]